jgi:hypothetical protein
MKTMAIGIHLFTQKTRDLKCGHLTRWAGALDGSLGQHLVAMDCATCVSRQTARDTLNEFALYVQLTSAVEEKNYLEIGKSADR